MTSFPIEASRTGPALDRLLFGALGGLLAWWLFGAFGDPDGDGLMQQLLAGGAIGYCVAAGTALRERAWLRAARLASYGLLLGMAGGLLGPTVWGWGALGLLVGMAEGLAVRAWRQALRGAVGGLAGGLLGGGLLALLVPGTPEVGGWNQPVALLLAGGCVGAGVAWPQAVFWPAYLAVLRGPQAGQRQPLFGTRNHVGSEAQAAVPLLTLERRHALIERHGDRYTLVNLAPRPEQTRLNGEPLSEPRDLKDGDRVQLGGVELQFHGRNVRARRAQEPEPPTLDAAAAHPLDEGPFPGAATVRELAARMQAAPQLAAPLFERGAVARWFARNGWRYPVRAATAPGLAAVQQFFEALGLAKAPVVELAANEVAFACIRPERLLCLTALRSASRKWVFAEVTSAAPWLQVVTPQVSGVGQAMIEYELNSGQLPPGPRQAQLHVLANAGQRLTLTVRVSVHQPHEPFTRRLLRPLGRGALLGLLLRALLAAPGDLFARLWQAPEEAVQAFAFWQASPADSADYVRRFTLAAWWWVVPFAALWWRRRQAAWADLVWLVLAGAAAGLALSATAACWVPALDAPPRLAWQFVARAAEPGPSPWWPLVWLVTVALWWALVGAVLNLVARRARSARRN